MANITVKNIPEDLYESLRQLAAANHRSLNSEIIVCIERTVRNCGVDAEAVLAIARQLREKTSSHPITDALFNKMKNQGRE